MIGFVNFISRFNDNNLTLTLLLSRSVNLTQGSVASGKVATEIRKFYFGDEKLTKKQTYPLVDILSDFHFIIGNQLGLELHTTYQRRSPVYFYRFSYDGELNLMKKFFQLTNVAGCAHADEMNYMFQ